MIKTLNSLKEKTHTSNYQPYFDKEDERLITITSFLEQKKYDFKVINPENDLFSYSIELSDKKNVFIIYIRFDMDIYTTVTYEKIGKSKSFIDNDKLTDLKLKYFYDLMSKLMFQNINFYLLQDEIELASEFDGVHNLFSFYFEDNM